jgi:predicted phosphohydrolase
MEVFGEHWRDHPERLAAAWDEAVDQEDLVLVCGDISWAASLEEARPDLAYLAARPGRKLLLRGNHDYWWKSLAKVREALPPGLEALQNDAFRYEGFVVAGARGWTSPASAWYEPERDEGIYRRELGRLALSLERAAALRRPGDDLLVMLHYPPCSEKLEETEVTRALAEHRASVAVYGHLHGEEDHAWAPRGPFRGTDLRFVAVDYTGFRPVGVWELGRGVLPVPDPGDPSAGAGPRDADPPAEREPSG